MSLTSTDNPTEGLSQFFDTIWRDTQGFVYLPTLDRKTNDWHPVFFKWPLHKKDIIQHVISGSARGKDVYYSPVIYKGEGENKPGRPVKDNIKGTHVLWAEFDGVSEDYSRLLASEGASDPAGPGDGHTEAQAGIPVPSVRVQSSLDDHEHAYWLLDEFVTDVKWLETKNRSMTYSFRSDTSGWDATQILRPPFTQNYKRDRPVTVINMDGPQYARQVFEPLVSPPQLVNESIVIDELPRVDKVIAKYRWDEEHFEMFMDPVIEEGKRSAALMRLGYFCIEAGMTNTEAYAILYNADERWGKYKGRADQKRRLVDIIDRARQKHPHASATADLTFAGLLGTKVETGRPLVYGFKDFLASDIKVEWVIEGLLEKGGAGLVAAMPGVGKTQLSIQLGIAAALGRDFLKWKIPVKQKVLLFSLEMSHVGLKIFMETIANEYTEEEIDILQENFLIVPLGEAVGLDKPEGLAFIESIVQDYQPTGIIFDSLGKLSQEDLNEKVVKSLNDRSTHLRKKYDVWFWLIHHNRKASDGNKKPTDLSDVYGSQYVTAEMTSALIMWPHPQGAEIITVKSRLSERQPTFTAIRNENLMFSVKPDEATEKVMELSERLNGESSNGHKPGSDGDNIFRL